MRGVEIVGTPLASVNRILATGPSRGSSTASAARRAATSRSPPWRPPVLVGEMELQRVARANERSPILPSPWTEAPARRARAPTPAGRPMSPPVPLPAAHAGCSAVAPRRARRVPRRRAGAPYATPIGLDAERRRLLNIDLSEPEVALPAGRRYRRGRARRDRPRGRSSPTSRWSPPSRPIPSPSRSRCSARAGPPRTGGGVEAREWIWGPESGPRATVAGEPVRLWVCAERAYGDRLWLVASAGAAAPSGPSCRAQPCQTT